MFYTIYALIYIIVPFIALCFIFKKAGEKPWKALVPVYNIVVWIKVCRKDWKWYLYFLVPAINIFTFLLMVVETAKVFRRTKLWEQTLAVIFPWAYLLWLGLSKMEYNPMTEEELKCSKTREWVEALIFALVAAIIIRGYVFELYNIPSSSMEKSLLIGDYLMVSKTAYGPRPSMTPLSFPLVHNVLPFTNGNVESYVKWIHKPYHRFPGMRGIKRLDATVFNYPDGDTVCTAFQSNRSYHDLVREYGRETVLNTPEVFGKIVVRPVDKRENFIKRCIGLPGETLEIRNQQVLIDGNAIENPADLQFTYAIRMKQDLRSYASNMAQFGANAGDLFLAKIQKDCNLFNGMGVSMEDCESSVGFYSYLFLTDSQLQIALRHSDALDVEPMTYRRGDSLTLVRFAPKYSMIDTYASEQKAAQAMHDMGNELVAAGVSQYDLETMGEYYTLPLPASTLQMLMSNGEVAEVLPLAQQKGYSGLNLFPHAEGYSWSVDNFGPLLIPAKGMTLELTTENLPLYRRAIEIYEGNSVEVRDGQILINGEACSSYTFQMDYYWMQGDNRHNSADSRYWGFVPEDHIVGRATAILFSKDKEKGGIRWNRILKTKF